MLISQNKPKNTLCEPVRHFVWNRSNFWQCIQRTLAVRHTNGHHKQALAFSFWTQPLQMQGGQLTRHKLLILTRCLERIQRHFYIYSTYLLYILEINFQKLIEESNRLRCRVHTSQCCGSVTIFFGSGSGSHFPPSFGIRILQK
jgi:hypothetical protein